jgi:hypothetical protein
MNIKVSTSSNVSKLLRVVVLAIESSVFRICLRCWSFSETFRSASAVGVILQIMMMASIPRQQPQADPVAQLAAAHEDLMLAMQQGTDRLVDRVADRLHGYEQRLGGCELAMQGLQRHFAAVRDTRAANGELRRRLAVVKKETATAMSMAMAAPQF